MRLLVVLLAVGGCGLDDGPLSPAASATHGADVLPPGPALGPDAGPEGGSAGDGGAVPSDAGAPPTDAAAPEPDAAAPEPDAAAPEPDAAAPEPDAAVEPPPSCDAQYGGAPGYRYCSETETSCTFYTQPGGASCDATCAAAGGTCLDSWAENADTCEPAYQTPCSDGHGDVLCTCDRP